MRLLATALLLAGLPACGQTSSVVGTAPELPVVTVGFNNPQMTPAHWTLTLHPDGSAHFTSERGTTPASGTLKAASIDRDLRLSQAFAAHIFAVAEKTQGFHLECESHLKVAFQGWKTFAYKGPTGQGSCTFNYSINKEMAALGEQMLAVATTIEEGAKLETLLAHDRLGLDRETEFLLAAARDGHALQMGAIRSTLERLATDDAVLERVRKRVRQLLLLE